MTDNEIVKALECCHQVNGCDRCPLRNDTDECEILNTYALDLIKRQKAEIERLKEHERIVSKMLSECWERIAELDELNENAKSEAIKEFAERLKGIYESDKRYDRPNAHTLVDKLFANIDNLVKEMTEKGGVK